MKKDSMYQDRSVRVYYLLTKTFRINENEIRMKDRHPKDKWRLITPNTRIIRNTCTFEHITRNEIIETRSAQKYSEQMIFD